MSNKTFKIFVDKMGGITATQYIGNDGELFYDPTTTTIRIGDGETPGGTIVSSGASLVDNKIWIETFASDTPITDIVQLATSVEYDADNNVIALLSHYNPDNNESYTSVAKISPAGSLLWQLRFSANLNTDGWGLAYDTIHDAVYIAGVTNGSPLAYQFATLTKLSGVDGAIDWSKTYDFEATSASTVVDVDSSGNPVMVGYANNGTDTYISTTKVDRTDGTVIWSRSLDGQGNDEAYGMAVGPNNEVIAIGWIDSLDIPGIDDNINRMIIIKYDPDGTIAWQKAVQFEAGYDCTGADADIDSNGNIYVCGQYQYDTGDGSDSAMCIVKFNSSGVKQWTRRVVGNCQTFATSIVVGDDNNLYLSGVTGVNATNEFIWCVVKYDTTGALIWQRLIDNTTTWTFGGSFFTAGGGGSNIAVRNGYIALAGTYGDPGTQPIATVVQIDTDATQFSVGDWDIKDANFTAIFNATASDITVVNAGKVAATIAPTPANLSPDTDDSNFLILTRLGFGTANFVGYTAYNDGHVTWSGNSSGDGGGYTTMNLVPDDTREPTDQYIIFDPTTPNHIHIRAGGTQDNSQAALYLGGESSYVAINSGLNPPVYVVANNYGWTFRTDGTLLFPDASVQTGGAISITELKALVANTTTYADLKTAIANL